MYRSAKDMELLMNCTQAKLGPDLYGVSPRNLSQ